MRKYGRVLVTGASGLLGAAVVSRFAREGDVVPLCHAHRFPGMIEADLLDPASVRRLDRIEWDAVINCAAFRNPDVCERDQARAHLLNVRLPVELARMAAARGAAMLHVSTDYVFPGTEPPYGEDDPPAPVNYYGETKVEAESIVRDVLPSAVIMRVPALYGDPPAPVVSTLVKEGVDAVLDPAPRVLDDETVRYPTLTDDVAEAMHGVLRLGFRGIVHVSAGQRTTRYEWALFVAGLLGRPAGHLKPGPSGVGSVARRPVDSHLATGRLEGLGLPVPRPFGEVLPGLLRKLGHPVPPAARAE